MRAAFAISLVLGMVGLIVWVVGRALGETAAGLDPEKRFGRTGRRTIAALISFGMGGLSAAYAGWPPWPAIAVAVIAAALGAWYAGLRSGDPNEEP